MVSAIFGNQLIKIMPLERLVHLTKKDFCIILFIEPRCMSNLTLKGSERETQCTKNRNKK